MQTYWGSGGIAPCILTSAIAGGEWSASRPGRFTPTERTPGTHWIGGWVGPRAVLDTVVKRKIPSPHQELNPRTPIVQPIASHYTDWAITAGTDKIINHGIFYGMWCGGNVTSNILFSFVHPRILYNSAAESSWNCISHTWSNLNVTWMSRAIWIQLSITMLLESRSCEYSWIWYRTRALPVISLKTVASLHFTAHRLTTDPLTYFSK
jgi:hypothetical protein